jgi:hypothetical protein
MLKTGESVDQMKEVVLKNRIISIYEVANLLGTSFWSDQSILRLSACKSDCCLI